MSLWQATVQQTPKLPWYGERLQNTTIIASQDNGYIWKPTATDTNCDNGITWKKNKYYQLPNDFDTSTTRYAATSDGVNIWLFGGVNGEVWRGRLNKLAW